MSFIRRMLYPLKLIFGITLIVTFGLLFWKSPENRAYLTISLFGLLITIATVILKKINPPGLRY